MALALAEAGADIISIQHTSQTEALAERITSTGRRFLPLTLDIGAETAAQEALEVALSGFGQADILVNNAGVQRRWSSPWKIINIASLQSIQGALPSRPIPQANMRSQG